MQRFSTDRYNIFMVVPGVHSYLHHADSQGEARERARQRLIVALDAPDAASAMAMADKLEGSCAWFKVGLELFVAAGPVAIEPLLKRGHQVFLDLKLHDIPNTVAGAVRSAAALGVRLLTVHAAGGPAMLAAAREALAGTANPPELLAVTVLTSMDEAQMKAVGVHRSAAHQVELLAKVGLDAGIRGFVCSPMEAATLRQMTGPSGVLVTPGIRPSVTGRSGNASSGDVPDDQKRIASPAEALRAGASYLVVGRPITQAADPAKAAEGILAEMAGVV